MTPPRSSRARTPGSRPLLARLCLAGALLALLAPWVMSCGEEASPPAPLSDTAARARAVFASFHVPDPERIPSRLATNPGEPWGKFVGSEACKRCHEEDYDQWRGSFHSRTLYDATGDTVFGDFSGTKAFDASEKEWIVKPHSAADPKTGLTRFYMDIRVRTVLEGGTGEAAHRDTYGAGILPRMEGITTFEVIYAFGNRRHQPYVVRDQAGQHWIAPVYWNDVRKEWSYDGWRPYVSSCGNCHLTGIRTNDKPWYPTQARIPDTFPPHYNRRPEEEQWAEGAVGCESCHGPGLDHIRAVESEGVDSYRRRLASGAKEPSIYDGKRGTFKQHLDACGRCHNFFTESSCTWQPGPMGYARDANYRPSKPSRDSSPLIAGNAMNFYPDGSHMSPCTAIAVYKTSAMFRAGVGCGACHDPHGTDDWADLILPIHNNELCISCHLDLESPAAQAAHSHHKAGGPGNLCVECHMARTMAFTNGQEMMGDKIHNHYFSIPTAVRRPGGPKSACNICHDDRSHAWSREWLARWQAEATKRGPLKKPDVPPAAGEAGEDAPKKADPGK